MNKIRSFMKTPKYRENILPEIKRSFAVIFFTLLYGIGVSWFLEQSAVPMYTGGIPGLAQVFRDIFVKGNIIEEASGDIFMSAFIFVVNIPILLLGWFGVSKRFTIYSMISVIIQSLVIGFLPQVDFGLNEPTHALLAAFLGGLLIGVGIGGALKYGTSTGGFDIVAQYFSFKKGISVGHISMVLNIAIAALGAFITGGEIVNGVAIGAGLIFSYTILRTIVTTLATDMVHTAYNYLEIQIITENPRELIDNILHKMGRGVTLSKVEGAYSTHEKTMIMVIISSYELQNIVDLIKEIDDKAFVIAKPVSRIIGNFKRKRIA